MMQRLAMRQLYETERTREGHKMEVPGNWVQLSLHRREFALARKAEKCGGKGGGKGGGRGGDDRGTVISRVTHRRTAASAPTNAI